MPRLRNYDYIRRHNELAQVWELASSAFGVLSAHQQNDLHSYYRPADDLTEGELVEHRRAIAKADPSLPNRAGRAFVIFHVRVLYAIKSPKLDHQSQRHNRELAAHSIMNPELNLQLLARALINQVGKKSSTGQDKHLAA